MEKGGWGVAIKPRLQPRGLRLSDTLCGRKLCILWTSYSALTSVDRPRSLIASNKMVPAAMRACFVKESKRIAQVRGGLSFPKRLGLSTTCCCWTATTLTAMLSNCMTCQLLFPTTST